MAIETVSAIPGIDVSERRGSTIYAGAEAFKTLLRCLAERNDADLLAHYLIYPEEDGCDARDYRALSQLIV